MVVAEVLTGIALVKQATDFIKSQINTAKDIGEIAGQIDDLFRGEQEAQKARNKKAGVAVGKQNKQALENRGIIKGTAGTVLAGTALDMIMGDSNQKTEAKPKNIGGGQMKRNRKNVKTKTKQG